MTEAEEQELFVRVEKLEWSAWRWRAFASVLAVLFLLLGSLGLVSFVAFRAGAVERQRLLDVEAREAERRARAEEAVARQRWAEAVAREQAARQGAGRGTDAPRHMPRGEGP